VTLTCVSKLTKAAYQSVNKTSKWKVE